MRRQMSREGDGWGSEGDKMTSRKGGGTSARKLRFRERYESFLSGIDAEDRNPGRGTEAWTCVTRASWQLLEVAASSPCRGPLPHSHSLGHLHCHPEQEGLTLTGISQLVVVKKRRLSGTSEKRISQLWMPKDCHFRPHPAIGPYCWVGMEEL